MDMRIAELHATHSDVAMAEARSIRARPTPLQSQAKAIAVADDTSMIPPSRALSTYASPHSSNGTPAVCKPPSPTRWICKYLRSIADHFPSTFATSDVSTETGFSQTPLLNKLSPSSAKENTSSYNFCCFQA